MEDGSCSPAWALQTSSLLTRTVHLHREADACATCDVSIHEDSMTSLNAPISLITTTERTEWTLFAYFTHVLFPRPPRDCLHFRSVRVRARRGSRCVRARAHHAGPTLNCRRQLWSARPRDVMATPTGAYPVHVHIDLPTCSFSFSEMRDSIVALPRQLSSS